MARFAMLHETAVIDKVKDASAAGITEINSDVIDMQGFEGVLFLTAAGQSPAEV